MGQYSMNTWLIADTHLGHDNIIKYCDRPANHDFVIVDNWRTMVHPGQLILHLGDVTVWFGMKKKTWESVVKDLPGRKRLILGNHDAGDTEYYEALGFKVLEPFTTRIGVNRIHFSHEPEMVKSEEWDINIHGHLHNNDHRVLPNGDAAPWRRNISIELTNYRPIQIGDAI